MNLALSDEQEFLRGAARGALARLNTVAAARAALEDPSQLPDLWPALVEAGWTGLLIGEERDGAGLQPFDAMLVLEECGRVLAPTPLLGLLPASYLLDRGRDPACAVVAGGKQRPVLVLARPPGDAHTPPGGAGGGWTVDERSGLARADAPTIAADGVVNGSAAWVVDAPGADLLVVVGTDASGAPGASVVEAGAATVEAVTRYDATRSLGHVTFDGAPGRRLDVGAGQLAAAWYLGQALLGAESLGTVQTCLAMSVAYAKQRFTFGRAIGSYQAIKHEITEILRRQENARSLMFYAGWAGQDKPDEWALAASAFRSSAGHALDFAARANIDVHGGIGATWEHDAPLYFRRAQLSRRLFGGAHDATDRIAGELFAAQAVAAA